jgi:hypothetical protein
VLEGIGTDGDVSTGGVILLYKANGNNYYQKILYTHLSNDMKQNALMVRWNIEHLLNDIDMGGEIPRDKLNGVFEITDGCAVQYQCGKVLYSLAQIAMAYNIKYKDVFRLLVMGRKRLMDWKGRRRLTPIQFLHDQGDMLKKKHISMVTKRQCIEWKMVLR